jgi:hypothetical protein
MIQFPISNNSRSEADGFKAREGNEQLTERLELGVPMARSLAILCGPLPNDAKRAMAKRAANRPASVAEFMAALEQLPAIDPDLPSYLKEAQNRRLFDSSYRVGQGLRLLRQLPEHLQPIAIKALGEKAVANYICGLILAHHYIESGDRESALPLLRAASHANALDLYVEDLLIDNEAAAAESKGHRHPAFSGLREYLAGSFCDRPWTCLDLNAYDIKAGYLSVCDAWSPVFIGGVHQNSLFEIWNSRMTQEYRKSILDGSFRYCSKLRCPHISGRTLPKRPAAPKCVQQEHSAVPGVEKNREDDATAKPEAWGLINKMGPTSVCIGVDRNCNLACPQCRADFHVSKKSEEEEANRILGLFSPEFMSSVRSLRMNTAGEVFFGKPSRRFLKSLTREQFPDLRFDLISNGQLLNRRTFDEFDLRNRMVSLSISMDAATEATYRIVRRGGDFSRLLSNLAFLDSLRHQKGEKFTLFLEFIVSAWNFREMPLFVRLAKQFHADRVVFGAIFNAHFTKDEFSQIDIADTQHPSHSEFLEVLNAPELCDPIVMISGLSHLKRNSP